MRYLAVVLAGLLLPCAVWAQKQWYAIPMEKNLPVYQNEIRKLYEKPLFFLDENGRYFVKETRKNSVKIIDREGNEGWVQSGQIKLVPENKSYSYDPAEVQRWLDCPQPYLIFGDNDQKNNPLILDRSFAEALRENVDQETIFRQASMQ